MDGALHRYGELYRAALTDRRGSLRWSAPATRWTVARGRIGVSRRGREVSRRWVMAAFSGAADAVDAAVGIQQAFRRWQDVDGDIAKSGIRVGVSIGDALRGDSDLHGTVVVEAARLCAAAQPGQILCSELVRLVAGSRGGHVFASLGDLTLKGLGGPLPSCEVHWEPAPSLPEPVGGPALRLPFVGRNREAALFEQMLGAAARGSRSAADRGGRARERQEPSVGGVRGSGLDGRDRPVEEPCIRHGGRSALLDVAVAARSTRAHR